MYDTLLNWTTASLHPFCSRTMSSRPQSASASSANPSPDAVSCWLCLEEGPDDESGAPLVRDCSCRGHSGFAHLPCLVKYAERKSKELVEKGMFNATDMLEEKAFEQCPNCKQAFQGDLCYDLTKAQLSFVEREFKDLQGLHVGALMKRNTVLNGKKEADRLEGEEICLKMLSLVDEMKKKSNPSLNVIALTGVYQDIGKFNFEIGTKCSLKKAKHYAEKARGVIITSGDRQLQWLVKPIENNIAKIETMLRGESPKHNTSNEVSCLRARYNYFLRFNECSVDTIQSGIELAEVLFKAYHTVEAVRLLETLVATSRRVHGSGHQRTKDAVLLLKKSLERYVVIESKPYQALRYENDGDSCVVEGPVPNQIALGELRKFDNEKLFSVASTDINVVLGTPVVLHGLKKAAHLNGEIGDVRDYCHSTNRYVVHLENKCLKPVRVKHYNLRIVFDLPGPTNLD
jgi:hypothetical protein